MGGWNQKSCWNPEHTYGHANPSNLKGMAVSRPRTLAWATKYMWAGAFIAGTINTHSGKKRTWILLCQPPATALAGPRHSVNSEGETLRGNLLLLSASKYYWDMCRHRTITGGGTSMVRLEQHMVANPARVKNQGYKCPWNNCTSGRHEQTASWGVW